jgi:adenylate cyclase class IV
MFEVELKFSLTATEQRHLLQGANFIGEEDFVDIYYDHSDYRLTTKDIWLRSRNGKFLLKTPLPTQSSLLKTQKNTPKKEIEEEVEILKYFNIEYSGHSNKFSLEDVLAENSIFPLYKFRNIRQKYNKQGFIIDLDRAIFEDFTYEVCEIELLVERDFEIDQALKKIEQFAEQHGIQIVSVEGRLIEYIRRKNPKHYQLLLHSKR